MSVKRRVALVCYKIQQGLGSEDGSGYNFARELATAGDIDLTLYTRLNNVKALSNDPSFASVRIIGVDPPRYLTWWKKGPRGIIPFYYLWQFAVGRRLDADHEKLPFDVVHQYNFHTDWAPHFIRAHGARVIWGPICHQPRMPLHYNATRQVPVALKEVANRLAKQAFWRLDPNLRRAIGRTDLIMYANRDIAPPFRGHPQVKQQTFGGASFKQPVDRSERRNTFTVLFVGRLVPIKGALLALRAFADVAIQHPDADLRLVIIGDGPLAPDVRRAVERYGLADVVDLLEWQAQEELANRYAEADVLLYPSLGNQDTVVAEALSFGLPVIGVSGGGTEALASFAGKYAPRRPKIATHLGLTRALADVMRLWREDHPAYLELCEASLIRSEKISWEALSESLRSNYGSLSDGSGASQTIDLRATPVIAPRRPE